MASWILWTASLSLALVVMIVSAGAGEPRLHMAVTALTSLGLGAMAVRDHRALLTAGASPNALGTSDARHMGLIWAWGAVGLFVTYAFILRWPEWWKFTLAFAAVAALCLFIAAALARDEQAGRTDPTMQKLARALTIGQVAGMALTVVGLVADGKMARAFTIKPNWEDWAANNIFFFGALALIAVSANALWRSAVPHGRKA